MQLRTKVKAGLVGVVVTGGGVTAALLGPAGPAVGQSSQPIQVQIQLNQPGTLAAKGAAVDVLLTSECSGPPGTTASIGASLTERGGGGVLANGNGFVTVGCTGTSQTTLVVVTAQPGRPFKRGTALASASINACTPNFFSCAGQGIGPTTFAIK